MMNPLSTPHFLVIPLSEILKILIGKYLIETNELEAGIAFPKECSMNFCAVRWTPNRVDNTFQDENDVCKFGFGTQVDGWIIDSTFLASFIYKILEEAIEIKNGGIDVRLCEVGVGIQEVIESYEIQLDGSQIYKKFM